jgi:hypothetical protein
MYVEELKYLHLMCCGTRVLIVRFYCACVFSVRLRMCVCHDCSSKTHSIGTNGLLHIQTVSVMGPSPDKRKINFEPKTISIQTG